MPNNEHDEELLEKVTLKSATACEACGAEDCICAKQEHAVAISADVESTSESSPSTAADDFHEPKVDSPQQLVKRADDNQTSRETDGDEISTHAIGHTFRDVLSICLLEFLDDRTLCGAFLAFGSLMLSFTLSIAHYDYGQVRSLVDPCFRAMAAFMVVRQILCWIIRRSRSQEIRKATIFETLFRTSRYLSNFTMVTLVSLSICLRLLLPAVFRTGSQFVWTVNGHSFGTPLLILTAISIVAVIVQEVWAFLRLSPISNSAGKGSWKARIAAHYKRFSRILDISFAALMTITGTLMMLFWSDLVFLSGATFVAESVRDHKPWNGISCAKFLAKHFAGDHAAEAKYLVALVDASAGKKQQAKEDLNQALSDLQEGKPNQRLKTSILDALAKLSQSPSVEQEVNSQSPGLPSASGDSGLNNPYNLIYGPFVLNLQMQIGTPAR